MVVMDRLTRDVGMLPGRKVDALDDAELDEDVERPKDGRPPDAHPVPLGVGDEVRRGEVGVSPADQLRDRAPRPGQAVAPLLEGVDEGSDAGRLCHGSDDTESQ